MTHQVHQNPNLIYSIGTQVVSLQEIVKQSGRTIHPRGAVGVIIKSPGDLEHSNRVRFPDGMEEALRRDDVVMQAHYKEGGIGEAPTAAAALHDLLIRVRLSGS